MVRVFVVLGLLLLTASCKPNKVANSTTDSSATSNNPAAGKTANATGLTGIWVKENSDNPAFEITEDNFSYPDYAASYPYDKSGDTIMVHYKDFIDTFKSELRGNDTLILSNKADGRHIYHRFKNQ